MQLDFHSFLTEMPQTHAGLLSHTMYSLFFYGILPNTRETSTSGPSVTAIPRRPCHSIRAGRIHWRVYWGKFYSWKVFGWQCGTDKMSRRDQWWDWLWAPGSLPGMFPFPWQLLASWWRGGALYSRRVSHSQVHPVTYIASFGFYNNLRQSKYHQPSLQLRTKRLRVVKYLPLIHIL